MVVGGEPHLLFCTSVPESDVKLLRSSVERSLSVRLAGSHDLVPAGLWKQFPLPSQLPQGCSALLIAGLGVTSTSNRRVSHGVTAPNVLQIGCCGPTRGKLKIEGANRRLPALSHYTCFSSFLALAYHRSHKLHQRRYGTFRTHRSYDQLRTDNQRRWDL